MPCLGSFKAARRQCKTISSSDFEHLGEYVMERMVGSRSVHGAIRPGYEQRRHRLPGLDQRGIHRPRSSGDQWRVS